MAFVIEITALVALWLLEFLRHLQQMAALEFVAQKILV
jgi:hypothetical protein